MNYSSQLFPTSLTGSKSRLPLKPLLFPIAFVRCKVANEEEVINSAGVKFWPGHTLVVLLSLSCIFAFKTISFVFSVGYSYAVYVYFSSGCIFSPLTLVGKASS